MATSESEVEADMSAELELESEEESDHTAAAQSVNDNAHHDDDNNDDSNVNGSGRADDTDTDHRPVNDGDEDELRVIADDDDDPSFTLRCPRPNNESLSDSSLTYGACLWDSPKVVVEQSEAARASMKGFQTLLREKVELDRYYAKTLKKIVDRASAEQQKHTVATAITTTKSQFEILFQSFRHLTATLASNMDILAAMVDEKVQLPLTVFAATHSRETKRINDEIARLQNQMASLNEALTRSSAQSKKACLDFKQWQLEQRQRDLHQQQQQQHDAKATSIGHLHSHSQLHRGEHSVFDVFTSSFSWDYDSIKKKTLSVDNKYVAAIKAIRSFRPTYDITIAQLLNESQALEEQRRQEELAAMNEFLSIHGAMFTKAAKNVRSVMSLGTEVNLRREIRQFVQNHRTAAQAPPPLPVYVLHKGHPLYAETSEKEEIHSEDEKEASASASESESEDDSESDTESDDDSERDEADDENEHTTPIKRPAPPTRRPHHNCPHTLDESATDKSDERIVAEKVLRVFINKAIGRREDRRAAEANESETAANVAALMSPSRANLTKPLPPSAWNPVTQAELTEGAALSEEEEAAAKAIFSTRDGRFAFATIFSALSPTFHSNSEPLMATFTSFPEPSHTLTVSLPSASSLYLYLPLSSFAHLASITALFLDAAHSAYHVEPVTFIAQVAYEIARAPASSTNTTPASTLSTTTSSSLSSSSHLDREPLEDEAEPPHSLLSQLTAHPIFSDLRFYNEAFFASLQSGIACQTLFIHRWYSDAEQEVVMKKRKLLTFQLLGLFSLLMRACNVKRSERRKFVDKQARVFDLLSEEFKGELRQIRALNDRPNIHAKRESIEEEDGEGSSPLDIDGLKEIVNEDTEEESRQSLLRKKDEEKKLMQAERRRKRKAEAAEKEKRSALEQAQRLKDEQRRREEGEKKNPKRASATGSLMASLSSLKHSSWFGRSSSAAAAQPNTAPSVSPIPSPLTAGAKPSESPSAGVRIPIAVAQPIRTQSPHAYIAPARSPKPTPMSASATNPPAASEPKLKREGSKKKKKAVSSPRQAPASEAPPLVATQTVDEDALP